MTTFEEREKAFEAKYKRDQELRFKVGARRNKLLGLWAAQLMGLSGDAAQGYAREVVAADFQRPGDQDVVEKIIQDLAGKGVEMSEHRVRREMERLAVEARRQLTHEVPLDETTR